MQKGSVCFSDFFSVCRLPEILEILRAFNWSAIATASASASATATASEDEGLASRTVEEDELGHLPPDNCYLLPVTTDAPRCRTNTAPQKTAQAWTLFRFSEFLNFRVRSAGRRARDATLPKPEPSEPIGRGFPWPTRATMLPVTVATCCQRMA